MAVMFAAVNEQETPKGTFPLKMYEGKFQGSDEVQCFWITTRLTQTGTDCLSVFLRFDAPTHQTRVGFLLQSANCSPQLTANQLLSGERRSR